LRLREGACQQGRRQLQEVLKRILDYRTLTVEDPQVVRAALATCQTHSLRFEDGLAREVARKAGHLPLGACDPVRGECRGP
jgi:hypothetical protein